MTRSKHTPIAQETPRIRRYEHLSRISVKTETLSKHCCVPSVEETAVNTTDAEWPS